MLLERCSVSVFALGFVVSELIQAVVADQSACCTLTLRGPAQMEIAQPGAHLTLRNAKTVVFDEHIRLTIDQFGLMQPDPNPVEGVKLNMDNDLSKVAYELVHD